MSTGREADWTCEHGVVHGEGCSEYGCAYLPPSTDALPAGSEPRMGTLGLSGDLARKAITDALRAHTLMPAGWFRGARCFCGWRVNSPRRDGRSRLDQYRAHAALHIVRALRVEQERPTDHLCDWCERPMTRSATDECANPEHRAAEPTLGLREAGCGCCVVVDRVALDSLRGVR